MDDEELEQGGQGQKNGGRSPAGRARDFADKAKNVEKGAQRRSQAHKNKAEQLAKNNKGANTAKNAKKSTKTYAKS